MNHDIIRYEIIGYLDIKNILHLCTVNNNYYKIYKDNYLWDYLLQRDFKYEDFEMNSYGKYREKYHESKLLKMDFSSIITVHKHQYYSTIFDQDNFWKQLFDRDFPNILARPTNSLIYIQYEKLGTFRSKYGYSRHIMKLYFSRIGKDVKKSMLELIETHFGNLYFTPLITKMLMELPENIVDPTKIPYLTLKFPQILYEKLRCDIIDQNLLNYLNSDIELKKTIIS